jgi:indole-3-glycerol phosphate synthase
MTILDKIIEHKKTEVALRKKQVPVPVLESSCYYAAKTYSLRDYIINPDKSGIIAEFKRKSPSKSAINLDASVADVTMGYNKAGVSALSILTDTEFFGGNNDDLTTARNHNAIPILRKDFIIDEYQIIEAKSIGADAILLIAAVLNTGQLKRLAKFACSLNLEVLMEVHQEEELKKVNEFVQVIGVNNRNLKDFSVSLELSISLSDKIPDGFIKISESGIYTTEDIKYLKKAGFKGFLIGDNFMREADPGKACEIFTCEINNQR